MASYAELVAREKQLKAQGKSLSTSKKFAKIYNQVRDHPIHKLVSTITKEIVELDRQLSQLGSLGLTDAEKQSFLEKAIEQVTPYYERKANEIEQGISEGKVRTAEDTLLLIREVEQETRNQLEQFDLRTAQTEEEFLDKLGFITAQADEDESFKREEWRQRLENTKFNQIQSGIFTSGIGKKKREEIENLKQMELSSIERQEQEQLTNAERNKKYDLENIRLAREAAKNRRERLIGAPEQTEATREQARATLGLGEGEQLPSEADVQRGRVDRGVSPIFSGGENLLRDLDEERLTAVESRKQELQENELAIRDQEYQKSREKILAERAKKAQQLGSYGISI